MAMTVNQRYRLRELARELSNVRDAEPVSPHDRAIRDAYSRDEMMKIIERLLAMETDRELGNGARAYDVISTWYEEGLIGVCKWTLDRYRLTEDLDKKTPQEIALLLARTR